MSVKYKLLCLSNAGGTGLIFYPLKKLLDKNIELVILEYKGRGSRSNEAFYNSTEEAIDDLLSKCLPHIENSKYSFFGYSIGSWVAFELSFALIKKIIKHPEHMFFAARHPPHIKKEKEKYKEMSDEEFIKKIISYGGTPDEIFMNKNLFDSLMPILRADLILFEDLLIKDLSEKKYNCSMTVFGGYNDSFNSLFELDEWKKYTNKEFQIIMFDGGHFFLNNKIKEIAEIINQKLKIG